MGSIKVNNNTANDYPPTAITTWSGFVYQGKIALYHCLKLISKGDENFDLQLDSSDDFAIYKNGALISAHQVKAKIGKYRSSYITALEKSSSIEHDRVKGISRYFHVSVKLDDTSDYTGENGELVKFYSYGSNKYCGLGEITKLTTDIISQICNSKSIKSSTKLIDYNYCLLSEKISSKAMEIHRLIQDDSIKANKAAYENRISAESLLNDILSQNPYNDTEYYAITLKAKLSSHLESRIDKSLSRLNDQRYARVRHLFEHIQMTDVSEFKKLCQLIKPSVRFSTLQNQDIRNYCKLIETINIEPILKEFPHYLDVEKNFYLPTALSLKCKEDQEYVRTDLLEEMKSNGGLLELLFEYNNLIPFSSKKSFVIDTKYTLVDNTNDQKVKDLIDSNITKSLCLSIITKKDAEDKLNVK